MTYIKHILTILVLVVVCSCKEGQKRYVHKNDKPKKAIRVKMKLLKSSSLQITSNWKSLEELRESIKILSAINRKSYKSDDFYSSLEDKCELTLEKLEQAEQKKPHAIVTIKSISSRMVVLKTYLIKLKGDLEDAQKKHTKINIENYFNNIYISYNIIIKEIMRLNKRQLKNTDINMLSIMAGTTTTQ